MIARSRKFVEISVVSTFLMVLSYGAQAQGSRCFANVKDYLTSTYGETYSDDDNIITSKKRYGNQIFTVVEDVTSGTNHSFTLIKQISQKNCIILVTPPVVSLEVLAYDKSGFPVELISVDQAAPGSMAHEISYSFNSEQNMYTVASCREVQYQGTKRYATSVDCKEILNY